MSFQEKSTWIMTVIAAGAGGVYFAILLGQARTTPIDQIAYQGTMVACIVAAIVLAIIAHIVVAIPSPKEADKSDERDTNINRFGEYIGSFVLYGGGLLALGLALAEIDQFWIANALFTTFILAGLTTSAVKLVAYRRGF